MQAVNNKSQQPKPRPPGLELRRLRKITEAVTDSQPYLWSVQDRKGWWYSVQSSPFAAVCSGPETLDAPDALDSCENYRSAKMLQRKFPSAISPSRSDPL